MPQAENNLPNFFVHCLFIDILSIVISCMNQYNIDFQLYNNLYYETLYFCRSCSYQEKATVIIANIRSLLSLYERESTNKVSPSRIRLIMEESYSNPNFSIASMADSFQVSIAYMSYLVQKEIGYNFSDYLWSLRLKKAQELLLTTQYSIDEISIAVGYLNPSSFRRKFKQELGITPNQFRSNKKQS